MREIEVRNPERDKAKDFIRELRQVSFKTALDGEDNISRGLADIVRSIARQANNQLVTTSPFVLAFVYHPKGEILVKGFYHDVAHYISRHFPVHIYRLEVYDNRARITKDGLVMHHGHWYGSDGIRIHSPCSMKTTELWEYHARVEESKKTLRKWRVDIAGSTFYFKRMPNRWLPIFSEALKEIESHE